MAKHEDTDRKQVRRRDVLKGTGLAAVAAAAGSVTAGQAAGAGQNMQPGEPKNPYGTPAGYGISLPEYYRPTPSVSNRNFFPPGEVLAEGEMRICFPGSTPWPMPAITWRSCWRDTRPSAPGIPCPCHPEARSRDFPAPDRPARSSTAGGRSLTGGHRPRYRGRTGARRCGLGTRICRLRAGCACLPIGEGSPGPGLARYAVRPLPPT